MKPKKVLAMNRTKDVRTCPHCHKPMRLVRCPDDGHDTRAAESTLHKPLTLEV